MGATWRILEQTPRFFSSLRLKRGVPPAGPYVFFRNLWQYLWPEHLHLHVATHKGQHVASLMTLGFGPTLSRPTSVGPGVPVVPGTPASLWKAMEMGCIMGYKSFNFLRTPKNAEDLGHFKRRWNAFEVDLEYLYHPRV